MRIESVQFFQPVSMKYNERRSPLVTAASDKTHDIEFKDNLFILIRPKGTKDYTYVTIHNTCWFIPAEVTSEPSTEASPTARDTEKKVKRSPVVKVKLPSAD